MGSTSIKRKIGIEGRVGGEANALRAGTLERKDRGEILQDSGLQSTHDATTVVLRSSSSTLGPCVDPARLGVIGSEFVEQLGLSLGTRYSSLLARNHPSLFLILRHLCFPINQVPKILYLQSGSASGTVCPVLCVLYLSLLTSNC